MWYDSILDRIKKLSVRVIEAEIVVNPVNVNNVSGHKKENINKFKDLYDIQIRVKQDSNIPEGTFEMNVIKSYRDYKYW